jgi:hypothetical protein
MIILNDPLSSPQWISGALYIVHKVGDGPGTNIYLINSLLTPSYIMMLQ